MLCLFLLSGCAKRISGVYICREDYVEFKSDGTFSLNETKRGIYKISGDQITLLYSDGTTMQGKLHGDSVIKIDGVPPLIKR
jgi:hypothetical protein